MEFVSVREDELKKQGWRRMFTVESHRVAEYVEMYEQIGMDVLVEEPTATDEDPGCSDCTTLLKDLFRTIYTRPRKRP